MLPVNKFLDTNLVKCICKHPIGKTPIGCVHWVNYEKRKDTLLVLDNKLNSFYIPKKNIMLLSDTFKFNYQASYKTEGFYCLINKYQFFNNNKLVYLHAKKGQPIHTFESDKIFKYVWLSEIYYLYNQTNIKKHKYRIMNIIKS